MNEKRKEHSDYINNKFMTAEQEKADDLACTIKFLLQKRALPSKIVQMLYNMLKTQKTLYPKRFCAVWKQKSDA